MAESTIWWLLTGAAIGVELITGTFYLLMLACGLASAAIAAHLGASNSVQLVAAALVGAGSVLAWRAYKKRQGTPASASTNHDVNLDIGETVQVEVWHSDGTSSVKYRGANWAVSSIAGVPLMPGPHQVVEVVGSRLIVKKL